MLQKQLGKGKITWAGKFYTTRRILLTLPNRIIIPSCKCSISSRKKITRKEKVSKKTLIRIFSLDQKAFKSREYNHCHKDGHT